MRQSKNLSANKCVVNHPVMKRNPSQKRAIAHLSGPMMVLAGPGSGKTSVIVERTAHMIHEGKIPASSVLVVTFSRAAAVEMKERFLKFTGVPRTGVTFGTFHGVFYGILKQAYGLNGSNILSEEEKYAILRELAVNCATEQSQEGDFVEDLAKEISVVKGGRISLEHYYSSCCPDEVFRQIFKGYRKVLNERRKLDFDDMLLSCYELLRKRKDILAAWQKKFQYILVDEFQDINHLQYDIVKMLAAPENNLFVVGDDDQSIYKFRGANITNILNFEKEYEDAKVIKLEQNYRSCGNILAAANAVIQHNAGRKDKALWTDKDAGEKISFEQCDSEYAEGDMVASRIKTLVRQGVDYRDIAILYRTNAQSRVLGEKMVYANIPYRVYGGTNFYARKEIKDVLAYLKVINNSTDNLYFRRVVNVPKRGIGEASLSKVESFADAYGLSMMDAAARADEIPGMAAKTSAKIRQFAELITSFRDMLADGESLDSVYDRILEDTGYESELIAEHTEEAMTRLENIDELRNKVVEFTEDNEEAGLSEFLEEIALVSDLDAMSEDDNQVKLMRAAIRWC